MFTGETLSQHTDMLHLCGRKTADDDDDDDDKEERRRDLIRACFSPKVRLRRLVLLTTDGDYRERKPSLERLNIKEEVWESLETEAARPIENETQKPQIKWRQTEKNVKEEPSSCSLVDLIKKESDGDTEETDVNDDWQEPQFENGSRNHKKKTCTSRKKINTGKESISEKFHAEKKQKEKPSRKKTNSRKSCDVCGKHFSDITHQRRHMRFHTGEKPFGCDLCGQTFTQKSTLTGHMRVHTGEKPFSCSMCGKSFSTNSNLRAHTIVHTGEKPLECDVCAKRFSSNKLLTSHMSSHTGQKPFSCDVCAQAFSQNAHLTSHMSIHTGVKPFVCSVCSRSFRRNTHLRSHMRVHSKKKNCLM
ncbi:zinc finger protein 664-like [Gouania willdenowi]|uniref:Zinc finger protein 664-like n=1 Tax=Gouania willdenowi TaxID=441366 RepID=A0A8C5D5V7_GOUWI|nr:zinc finger protein 664-like [Gouania willdenowi]